MYAILLAGYKDSGKTELAVSLCRQLREMGYSVSAVKFSHHGLDRSGSDTQRLTQAAGAAGAIDPESTHLSWSGQWSLLDLLPRLSSQVLILEGGKHLRCLPRIILPREAGEVNQLSQELGIAQWGGPSGTGLTRIQDTGQAASLVLQQGFLLPDLDCGGCGRQDCFQLAREIVAGGADFSQCSALSQESIEVSVNGTPVPLNPFVKELIRNTLQGMFSSLKGMGSGEIQVRIGS